MAIDHAEVSAEPPLRFVVNAGKAGVGDSVARMAETKTEIRVLATGDTNGLVKPS
jgi:hypothetical protein